MFTLNGFASAASRICALCRSKSKKCLNNFSQIVSLNKGKATFPKYNNHHLLIPTETNPGPIFGLFSDDSKTDGVLPPFLSQVLPGGEVLARLIRDVAGGRPLELGTAFFALQRCDAARQGGLCFF